MARTFMLATVLAVSLSACMSDSATLDTGTRITPEFFRYATIIEPPTDGTTGGWRAVCIKARTGQRVAHPHSTGWETGVQCALEFGSPIVNRQHGFIPLRMAQRISADVANEVAYRVLRQERGITATTCTKLIKGMNKAFKKAINGSAVNACGTTRWDRPVPEVIWPPE
jgi:hypothetical protein